MNPFDRIRLRRMLGGIGTCILVVILGIFCVMTVVKMKEGSKQYYIPAHDENALRGVPGQVALEEITPKEGMKIGFSIPPLYREDRLYINLTNYEENDFYLSALLYDDQKHFVADSGLIDNGEYLPYLIIEKRLDVNADYLLKVVAYHKDKMTNEGSVWIRVLVTEE